jgi:hypothetical protein
MSSLGEQKVLVVLIVDHVSCTEKRVT